MLRALTECGENIPSSTEVLQSWMVPAEIKSWVGVDPACLPGWESVSLRGGGELRALVTLPAAPFEHLRKLLTKVGVWMPGRSGSRLQDVVPRGTPEPGTDQGNRAVPIIRPKRWLGRMQDEDLKWRDVLKIRKTTRGSWESGLVLGPWSLLEVLVSSPWVDETLGNPGQAFDFIFLTFRFRGTLVNFNN